MRRSRSFGEKCFDSGNVLLMLMLSAITLYPLLYVLFASLSDPALLIKQRGLLLYPQGFNLSSYKAVLSNPMIGTGYLNTIGYVVFGTALNMIMTVFAAYGLSRKNVMWRTPILIMIVFTMFFSGGLVPTYLLVQSLGMLDTRWALIVPGAVSAWNMIVMRTAFQAIPESLEESARMDGANDGTILFRIVIPLSLPVMAVMILFYGVGHWNAWFAANLYLRDRGLFPLQLILREILIQSETDNMTLGTSFGDQQQISETIKYATIMIATVPILFLYPFLQKFFVKGVMIGAIKE
ncbi:MAG: carbohydrate ABC transporter permease [Cohnella sp.]|nr:carbohydrate ABC transporter permease [Cohnella sp.]